MLHELYIFDKWAFNW